MPFFDASALDTDPEGVAFLLAVFRWRYDPRRGKVNAHWSPLLGPHLIRFNRGLTAHGRARKPVSRASTGYRLSRQATFRLVQPIYRVTVRVCARV